MARLPLSIGTLHFVGIGGIGMSGIAEILNNLGYTVQGSDLKENGNTQRLSEMGVKILIGHDASHVEGVDVVIKSTAVTEENPEVRAAHKSSIPVIARAEMLAEIMRLKWSIAVAGTHGKTTTTSLVAHILRSAGKDPTIINGGIINSLNTNAKLGQGDWMVVEADESDGSFNKLPATIAVVTNIDPEHLDYFGDFETLQKAFENFVRNIPFYGFAAMCIDHPVVQQLYSQLPEKKLYGYGFTPQADVRGVVSKQDHAGMTFDVVLSDTMAQRLELSNEQLSGLMLPMLGEYNVLNALAAVTVCLNMGLSADDIRTGLASFDGVSRRFTRVASVDGIQVYDDYAHHPTEIVAVLKAARRVCEGRLVAVVQPHRYSRVESLFNEFCTAFNDADEVMITPIYPAGEDPIEGIDQHTMGDGLRKHGHKSVTALKQIEDLPQTIADQARPGDYIVCMGAGDITSWARKVGDAVTVAHDDVNPQKAAC